MLLWNLIDAVSVELWFVLLNVLLHFCCWISLMLFHFWFCGNWQYIVHNNTIECVVNVWTNSLNQFNQFKMLSVQWSMSTPASSLFMHILTHTLIDMQIIYTNKKYNEHILLLTFRWSCLYPNVKPTYPYSWL